jgi:hypothetical protein
MFGTNLNKPVPEQSEETHKKDFSTSLEMTGKENE